MVELQCLPLSSSPFGVRMLLVTEPTLSKRWYDFTIWPFDWQKLSADMDTAGAVAGGLSSDGLYGTWHVPTDNCLANKKQTHLQFH